MRSRSTTPHRGTKDGVDRTSDGSGCVDVAPARAIHSSSAVFVTTVIVDLVMWGALFYRHYDLPPGHRAFPVGGRYHMTISHFLAVLAVTDLVYFLCPPTRRHWYEPFRFCGALQLIGLTLQLQHNGVDGAHFVTVVRLALCVLRIIDSCAKMQRFALFDFTAVWRWRWCAPASAVAPGTSGPEGHGNKCWERWQALLQYIPTVPGPLALEPFSAAVFLFFPAALASTHYNMGEARVDAPLAGFQAGDAINGFIKLYVFEKLIGGDTPSALHSRALIHFALGVSLMIQWPFLPELIMMAPRPYVHVVAEIGCFVNGIVRLWWAAHM